MADAAEHDPHVEAPHEPAPEEATGEHHEPAAEATHEGGAEGAAATDAAPPADHELEPLEGAHDKEEQPAGSPTDGSPMEGDAIAPAASVPETAEAESTTNAAPQPQQPEAPVAPAAEPPKAAAVAAVMAVARIKFTARPDGFHVIDVVPPNATGGYLLTRLEQVLQVQRRNVHLFCEGQAFHENDVLSDVCRLPVELLHPESINELILQKKKAQQERAAGGGAPGSDDSLLDDIHGMIDMEFDVLPHHLRVLAPGECAIKSVGMDIRYGSGVPSKSFHVTLVKGYEKKPFLGGYRDKREDHPEIYHHAATQTFPEAKKNPYEGATVKVSRLTQTQGVSRSCQTMRECSTQMQRSDVAVDTTFDRIVIAKPYFSADELEVIHVEKTIKLQAFVRGWKARKIARGIQQERFQELRALEEEDHRRRQIHAEKRKEELERRMHPKSAKDFSVLHNELEAWRLQEIQRIEDAHLTPDERKIAMQELLKKETKLLQTVDRLQIQANQENRASTVAKKLDKMSTAKAWGKASTVTVETPFTVRAKELKDLYGGLLMSGLSVDERLDVLLHVKWTVKEFDCPLTREIVELIDREADLLNRGRKESTMLNLRSRVANLFLQFIETPEFNPEAMQVQKVPLEFKSRPLVQLSRK